MIELDKSQNDGMIRNQKRPLGGKEIKEGLGPIFECERHSKDRLYRRK